VSPLTALLVAVGAGVGTVLRFAWGHVADGRWPVGTLLVNTVGASLLGVCSGLALGGDALALLGVGFCGGLTTWSGLAVQTLDRDVRTGAAYLAATLVLGIGGCALGFWVGAGL
jgi:fluoride exporter